ncbi:MAG: hypothetical protein E7141_02650 [Rikenellaceae bacterium]|nr:hypothetical protein [Rikenellaceae bacterium]
MKRLTLIFAVALAAIGTASAQQVLGNGQVSGSLESSSIYYTPDKKIERPEDHFGSNNYIKVDYANGRFSAGIQMNAFLPALVGYEELASGYKFYLASKYIQWRDKNFEILVGDIFDQFGNGLIFRSFEDRQLGMNNSLEGVRAAYNFGRYVTIKGMYGRPRLYTEYSKTWVRGADLVISIADIIKAPVINFTLEGSYVNRYQSLSQAPEYMQEEDPSSFNPITGEMQTYLQSYGLTPNLNMYSGRLNFGWNGLSIHGEYVHKSKDFTHPSSTSTNPGWAALGEIGYNYKTFSVMGTFRALSNMKTAIDVFSLGTGNTINYLPALTRQYTYMLANLNPYQVSASGELGGQVDLCYSYRSKSNRYRYWNFHANFSTFYSLKKLPYLGDKRMLYWRDINVDVERQWNKKWKSTILYSFQDNMDHQAHIFVGDVTHKFNRKMSLRFEVQYLLSGDDKSEWDGLHSEGDWVAGLVEFNLAPHWSFYVQDMYNIGQSKTHYYNGGFSYTHNRTRVQLSYGRNRAGYICSGGVCRFSPAYTGVNLMLTSSF